MLSDLGQITSLHSPLFPRDFESIPKGYYYIYFTVALHYLILDHFLSRTGGFTASKVKMSYCHI